jgi:CheY-like chemotaxis protein
VTLFGFKESPSENMEQHRLVSLLVALLNLRIEITFAAISEISTAPIEFDGVVFSEKINEINNNLSIMSGYCQLARRDPDLSSEAIKAFDSILGLTEDVAESLNQFISERYNQETDSKKLADSNDIIKDIFNKNSISGNLHMIAGKPYTVNLNLNESPILDIKQIDFSRFINNTAQAFAKNVEEDEIITISTYSRDKFVYIDMSKHRDNFPSVEMVARFGSYTSPRAVDNRMKDSEFLKLLGDYSGEFAFDKHSRTPSYYSFRIPLYGKTSPPKSSNVKGKPNILAVDDQAVILDLLAGMCQSLGYEILTARDGEEGLKVFEKYRPDIVITDLAMPRMSGRELASHIKAISPETPVILITGWGVAVDEDKMKRSGVDYILRKPFRLEQLSELISKVRFSDINP